MNTDNRGREISMRAITIAKLALLCGPSLLAATVAQAQEPLAAETAARVIREELAALMESMA